MSAVVRHSGDDIVLAVRLSPRAAHEKIGGLWTDAGGQTWLSASVTAPPDKGRANAALIGLLAGTLGLPRSSISLEAGETSRLKRVRIARAGAAAVETIERLEVLP
ncbi:MAG TPA: DUF167 family protein [Sphingobium sp.]|uniref:DUF167 domain-containing protein n=1 Tax=Sphingobium sp. TaxID=1912891 RepID=UPI002ED350C5